MSTEPRKTAGRRRFKPYPNYKDSGVEWLGEIPAHWGLTKMWDVSRAISGGTPAKEERRYWDGDVPWVSPKDMKRRFIDSAEDSVTEAAITEAGLKLISPPAVLVVVRGMILAHSYPVAITRVPVTINQDMKALQLRDDLDPEFFGYWLQGVGRELLAVIVEEAAHGTKAIRMDRWRVTPVQVPPQAEQHAIAAFLDRETARIDALLAKKDRLIELLQEKRTALITRVVTKGLDPQVPIRHSGVEWLGEIPAHWDTRKIKFASALQTGITLGKSYESEAVETRPYLRVANVQDGYLDLTDVAEISVPRSEIRRSELRRGDVLMTEGGDFDKLGRGYVWEGQIPACLHQNHIFAARPAASLGAMFLAFVTRSAYGRAYFTATSKQSTNLASTNSTKVLNFELPLPPRTEQDRIVAFVEIQGARLDRLVAKVHHAVDRLNELRTALISAAVTGKIDVRQEADRTSSVPA